MANTAYSRVRNSYHNNLYQDDDFGTWLVLGEDPNCDLGGPHHNPQLGTLKGTFEDCLRKAMEMPHFFSWGGGGYLKKLEIEELPMRQIKNEVTFTPTQLYEFCEKAIKEAHRITYGGSQLDPSHGAKANPEKLKMLIYEKFMGPMPDVEELFKNG